jgi:ATPase subunit of ABC transporter with duplicated ATPase domains
VVATASWLPASGRTVAGKSTLVGLVTGDLRPQSGTVSASGGLGVMRQFVGGIRDDRTVRDLLLSIAPPRVRAAADRLDAAELAMMEGDDEPTQLRYAGALADWGDAGGYQAEVRCCCLMSRPIISTWPAQRPCRRAWSPTPARYWPSRAIGGSLSHLTGS